MLNNDELFSSSFQQGLKINIKNYGPICPYFSPRQRIAAVWGAEPYFEFIKSYNVGLNGPFCIGWGDEIASQKIYDGGWNWCARDIK